MRSTARVSTLLRASLAAAALAVAALAPAVSAQPLAWAPRAPMPVPTSRAGSAVIDRTLVTLGGTTANPDGSFTPTSLVQAYDADLDAWRFLTPLPQTRFAYAHASDGGAIYLAGGYVGTPFTLAGDVLAYDLGVDGAGSVRPLGNLQTPRMRTSGAVLNGKLYVVGGLAAGTTLASVEQVDLVTGASVQMPPLPDGREIPGVAAFGGWLYVMGGHDASGATTTTCWKLRPPSGPWTSCASLPFARAGGAEVADGRILLPFNNLGGTPPSAWASQVLSYDPRVDAWTLRGLLATVRHGAVGVIQDHLYVAGVDDATGQPCSEAAALEPSPWPALPWVLRPRMPTPRGGGVAALVDGRIVVAGGSNRNDPPPSGALATVEDYDVASSAWSARPTLAEPRFSAAGGVFGHTVYLAGGATPTGLSAMVLAYDASFGDSWFDGALNAARFRHGAAAIGSRIYVVGGWNAGPLASVEAYDLDEHASLDVAPLPAPRDLPTVVAADGVLYALGGYDASGASATDVWAYDPAADAWTPRASLPLAPGGAAGVAVNGRIVVLGGSLDGGPTPANVLRAVQVYDPAADAWSVVGALDTFRFMAMAVAVGGDVFLVGGQDGSEALGLVESFTLVNGYPPLSVIDVPANDSALNLRTIVVSGSASDDQGVARVEVSTDLGATWLDAAGTTGWTYVWMPYAEGSHVLLSRAVDVNGMVQESPYAAAVVVDWTPPSIDGSPVESPTSPAGGIAWWNAPVTVAFTCADALSGVARCAAPIVLSSEGAPTATGTATDRAGNAASAGVTVHIDRSPPSISASTSAPANAAGWWNAPVVVTFACADALSGVASCGAPVNVDGEGAETRASGTAVDLAGNSTVAVLPVSLDLTPPTVVARPTTPANEAGWWNAPVTVAFECADALSGVASCAEPATVAFDGVDWRVAGVAIDRADNVATGEASVNVDLTPPACTIAATGAVGPDGAYRSSAIVSVEGADALSGLAAIEVDAGAGFAPYAGPFVVGQPGTTLVTCRARDLAGNEGLGTLPIVVALDGDLAWTERAPMPEPATRPASGVVDRTLYVLGGADATARVTSKVWAYDADADAWRTMPPLPEPRTAAAFETLGTTIYLAGGTGGPTTLSTVLAYDTDSGTSRVLGALQAPRSRAGGAINAGKLYVVGGVAAFVVGTSSATLDSVEEVDLATGVSVTKLTLPAPRRSPGVASWGGWLYVMGGLDAANQPTDTCWKIRLASTPYPSPWLACATLPYPRSGDALHGHGRILLASNTVSANLPPTAWTADVLAYDPSADVWSVIGQRPTQDRGAAVGVVRDALFVAGGTDATGTIVATVSAPLHVPEWPALPWELRTHLPAPGAGATSAIVDGRVLLLGGTSRNDPPPSGAVATVVAYDPVSNAWATLPPLAEPRYHSLGGAIDGVAYLAGGTSPARPIVDDVLAYDAHTGMSWIDGKLLEPRWRHGAAVLGNRLYVAGGRGTNALLTSVEAYDVTTHASTPLAPLPGTRDMARVVAAAGRLFVLGGYEATSEPTMLEYDFARETWVSRPAPPLPIGSAPTIAVGRNIVAFGGAIAGPAPTEALDVVQLYDTAAGAWTVLGALDAFRARASAAFVGGWAYLMGGDDGAVPLALVEALQLDAAPPTSSILSPADGAATSARQLAVLGTASDDVGIQAVEVSDDGGATWTPASGRTQWSWAWLPLAEGEHVLLSRATDSSGVVQEPPASARVTVDWTPPAISASAGTPGANGWWNAPVTVGFACEDALSGVATCPDPATVSDETAGVDVSGTATDRAGNAAAASFTVRLDRTAPTCAIAAAGTPGGAEDVYRSGVVVTVSAADALAGVAAVEVSTGGAWTAYAGPVTVSAQGTTTVSCRVTDRAGNAGSGAAALTVDTVAPTVLVTSPPDGATGVALDAPITITFSEPIFPGPAWSQVALVNGKKVVAVATSISGSVVTLLPVDGLDRNKSYTVSVPGGAVADLAGNVFAGDAGATFRLGFATGRGDNGPTRSKPTRPTRR